MRKSLIILILTIAGVFQLRAENRPGPAAVGIDEYNCAHKISLTTKFNQILKQ